jgi:hypothetical protein
MNPTIRRIAVSGSAAVALLGGAAAITIVDSPTASATEQTTVHRAVTAPVNLPDGRTVRITGMGGYGHQASDVHVATVAAFKSDTTPAADPSLGTGLTPDGGAGAALGNPVTGTQTGYNQQVTTQSAGGYIGVGAATILLFLVIAIVRIRHGASKGDAALFLFLGVALAGTTIGTMLHTFSNSGVGSLSGVLSGM